MGAEKGLLQKQNKGNEEGKGKSASFLRFLRYLLLNSGSLSVPPTEDHQRRNARHDR